MAGPAVDWLPEMSPRRLVVGTIADTDGASVCCWCPIVVADRKNVALCAPVRCGCAERSKHHMKPYSEENLSFFLNR